VKDSLSVSPDSRVLVLAPHPDDESLAVGGLLQRVSDADGQCRLIFLTNGENNPWPQRAIERRWRIGPAEKDRWGSRRQLESTAAFAELGFPESAVSYWGFPDQGITYILLSGKNDVTDRLVEILDDWQPSILVTPSATDLHPDHSAASVFVRLALACRKITSYDPLHIEYRVHNRKSDTVAPCLILTLSDEERERKKRAILNHSSQLMLRPNLVKFAREQEKFVSPEEMSNLNHYPLRNVSTKDGELLFDLKLFPRLGAFGRAVLYLASYLRGTPLHVLTITLPRSRDASIDIRDAVTGDVVAHARLQGKCCRHRMKIPLSAIGSADLVCAKVARRFGFFDAAGWCALPISNTL
jgi:LmbE family N-acetylglucosaminyl deacetylase